MLNARLSISAEIKYGAPGPCFLLKGKNKIEKESIWPNYFFLKITLIIGFVG